MKATLSSLQSYVKFRAIQALSESPVLRVLRCDFSKQYLFRGGKNLFQANKGFLTQRKPTFSIAAEGIEKKSKSTN